MTAVALLAGEGYEIEQVDNGHKALSQVARSQPDLVLLDVMMPGIDGYEVCRQLKQSEQTRLIPVVFITALSDRRARLRGIEAGGDDFLIKPFDQLEFSARIRSLIHQKRLNQDLDHAEQVLFSLARTVESRDPNTGDHCERLAKLTSAFGDYLQLPHNQIKDLAWGGYLHDIGKVGIADNILMKTGPLTEAERLTMERHVLIGETICQPLRTMQGVLPIIRHHHERWNGTGYPDGLMGAAIPKLAQIFQLADIFDALIHARPYKPGFSLEQALAMMWQEVEQGWRDPSLMQQFEAFVRSSPWSEPERSDGAG
ncbi:MAG: response regulator [Cyanobacteria bacterium REEB459]|nr:response regulator [Cyanobacteria bacterium REEB459]